MSNLRIVARGNGVWYAIGSIGGRRIRKSLGTNDKQRAAEACALYEARLWKRHNYGEQAVRTFEEAALSYLEQGGERRYLANAIRHFKGRSIGSITPGEVRAMATALFPNGGPATRNRQALVPVRAVINHAHQMGWCPAVSVRQFEVPRSRRHEPVDQAWLDAFMAQADRDSLPHLSALVLFMHQTAARVSEAIGVLGEHVDLGKRVALLAKTKTDEWSARYLTAELVTRVAALDPQPGRRVFLYTDRAAVNRRIAAVCRRAKIEYRSTHAAGRHSFATNALANGADIKQAMDAGGWKSVSLFMETYVHSRAAGESVAAIFDRLRGPVDASAPAKLKRKRHHFGKR